MMTAGIAAINDHRNFQYTNALGVHSGIGMSGENVQQSCTAASSMSGGNIR